MGAHTTGLPALIVEKRHRRQMEGRGRGGDRGRKVGAAVSSPATSSADSQQDAGDELGEHSPPVDAEDKVSVAEPEDNFLK